MRINQHQLIFAFQIYYISSKYASINGGEGNDIIKSGIYYDSVPSTTINAGTGNDTITLGELATENVIEYSSGDGNDKIVGFNDSSTLKIGDGTETYSTVKSGSNIIVSIGTGKVTLVGAAKLSAVNILGVLNTSLNDTISNYNDSILINSGAGNDLILSYGDKVTINSGNDKDKIRNYGDEVSINAGVDNDSIRNYGDNVTIVGGTGNDTIRNAFGENILFNYSSGDGNDKIYGFNDTSTLQIGTDDYSTAKSGNNIVVTVGKGKITLDSVTSLANININNDIILTDMSNSTLTIGSEIKNVNADMRTKSIKITGNDSANSIIGGTGNDKLFDGSGNDSISGGSGKDTLSGGTGDDKLLGGAGNDCIKGGSGNDSLWGGKGNDSLWGDAGNDTFYYAKGNGKDYIYGFEDGDTLTLDGLDFTSLYKNKAVTLTFENGSITFKDYTATTFHIDNDTYQISGSKLVKK